MSKIDEVRSAMVAAMKAKDKDTKETLSALLAALKNKAIDKRADLTEEEEVQVILKEIKQTKETLEMTPADRTDIIEECEKRIAVLEQYAPKMMDEAEIKEVIAGVLSGLGIDAPTPKDKGRIMKELMPKVKGKADGKLVNDILIRTDGLIADIMNAGFRTGSLHLYIVEYTLYCVCHVNHICYFYTIYFFISPDSQI